MREVRGFNFGEMRAAQIIRIILISSDNFYKIYKSYPNLSEFIRNFRIGVYPARTINETGSNVGPVVAGLLALLPV